MAKRMLEEFFVRGTRDTLPLLEADGATWQENWAPMSMLYWALCFTERWPENPYYQDQAVLDAIVRLGTYNLRSVDDRGCYANNINGWDEWRTFAWMEAMELVRGELTAKTIDAWTTAFIGAGKHIMDRCIDMDVFDGGIPNHGIWGHAFLYRIGQLYGVDEYLRMAASAMERVLASQTPDGCFRELQSSAGIQGTPVTGYNIVSLLAINMYYGHSGDPKAREVLERGWHWWYDYLFPDGTTPPTMDFRMAYHGTRGQYVRQGLPGYFYGKPEGRYFIEQGWMRWQQQSDTPEEAKQDRNTPHTGPFNSQGLGFQALQYDFIQEAPLSKSPVWPEYSGMLTEEACVRRRHGWVAALSGMTNADNSNMGLRLWAHERQDCLSLYHQNFGLLVGSAHSLCDENFSSFVFYENGAAYYLPNKAYLKSTPSLDTLILRYGSNVGALSVDTTHADYAEIIFSIHGERGKRPERGIGHPISAMAVKAHLPLRLQIGDAITANGEGYALTDSYLRIQMQPGEVLDCGGWSLECAECPWEFRWPMTTRDAYTVFRPGEMVAIVEMILYHSITCGSGKPTASFRLKVKQ